VLDRSSAAVPFTIQRRVADTGKQRAARRDGERGGRGMECKRQTCRFTFVARGSFFAGRAARAAYSERDRRDFYYYSSCTAVQLEKGGKREEGRMRYRDARTRGRDALVRGRASAGYRLRVEK